MTMTRAHLVSALTSAQVTRVTVKMTLENMLTNMGIGTKQLSERYADFAQPSHDHNVYYGYEHHSQPAHGHVAYSKHSYGGGHKSNAAMQALTLLAFLFFLHILQQCLKDHMTAMQTPQIMVMSGGRDGEVNIDKRVDIKKLDKSDNVVPADEKHGSQTDRFSKDENDRNIFPEHETSDDLYLTKITTAKNSPKLGSQKYKSYLTNYANRSSGFPKFVTAQSDYT